MSHAKLALPKQALYDESFFFFHVCRAVLLFSLVCLAFLSAALPRAARHGGLCDWRRGRHIEVAMVPFQGGAGAPVPSLTEIAGDDLERSGQFKRVDVSGTPQPVAPAQVNYGVWRGKGADALVIGQVAALPAGASRSVFIC